MNTQPLAARVRPACFKGYFGQLHLLGVGQPLNLAIEQKMLHSMILWGPPGTGKTTLAKLLAKEVDADFIELSAVTAGVKEIRSVMEAATLNQKQFDRATVLFIDEVHRFNKSQQDAFLPFVEEGGVIFIGATTENPSFSLNNALLSRARVYVLKKLDESALTEIISQALVQHDFNEVSMTMHSELKSQLAKFADGDARMALNQLELMIQMAVHNETGEISKDIVKAVLGERARYFDRQGDLFYDQISALHKSVRGSDPDASLYWLVSMLESGCDPLYVARRVVRMASEDIGNADPRALNLALNAWQVQERLGSPEGELAIVQAVIYLASAPKSNAVYMAYKKVREDLVSHGQCDVPIHLRNAPTKLMKSLGYGKAYQYAHDFEHAYVPGEQYFPDELGKRQYYVPTGRGLEKKIQQKLAYLKQLDLRVNDEVSG